MASIQLTTEFKEFLRLLTFHNVDYLLVGGYAVGFHGFPRATIDIDIWVNRQPDNAARIMAVLSDFGFGECGLETSTLLEPGKVIRLGMPPNRIELLTGIDGVDFEACASRAVTGGIGGITLPIISLEDLKTNKLASGRHKDLHDLENLP